MPLGLTNGVLSFADGDVEHLLGKLDGITRTFGHEASMPQPPPFMALKSKLRHYRIRFSIDAIGRLYHFILGAPYRPIYVRSLLHFERQF